MPLGRGQGSHKKLMPVLTAHQVHGVSAAPMEHNRTETLSKVLSRDGSLLGIIRQLHVYICTHSRWQTILALRDCL